ncbi:hypothetical protein C3B44_01780 [Corynebacterium yudongzhengii]|uniref:Steryl acetyl hydrolase n=1 Tax=Corynebacterium yudongzhengii TaxID=2080740 RepID=A0A2U1TA25_9CORY|nr:alpha/beta hydrolase fold domain-containing protein [Corynebacterium yudongzhengii]AWB81226.1 hypothetical protein C3B44_01780 [Corynebacterium yudongzhengii]PWC02765.1 steryl acetyl hydrolase [Corynebacterium yudongzhengii]
MFIDPELRDAIASVPEQRTWDVRALRAAGDRAFGGTDSAAVVLRDVGGVETRLLGSVSAPEVVVVAIHGGGYVTGRAEFDDARNAELAQLIPGSLVVSPDYRLAPEHPYPAAVEDCLAVLRYVADTYPDIPLVLLGDSAGGGLVDQLGGHVDAELAARVERVILLEPCLDPRCDTASYDTYNEGPVWAQKAARAAWEHYLGRSAGSITLPGWGRSAPGALRVPRHLIVVNFSDPLRDEALNRARELSDAGVSVEVMMPAGSFHGGLSVPGTRVWAQVRERIVEFAST